MSTWEAKYQRQPFAICWSRDRQLKIADIHVDETQYSKGIILYHGKNRMSSHHIVNLILTKILIKPFGERGHAI